MFFFTFFATFLVYILMIFLIISGEDEEEDDDIMENEEFLAKDDVRVVSITNGLPEKLGKLSGISIKKIDEEITPIIKTPPKNVPQTRQRKSMKTTTKISEQPSPLHEPQVNLTVFVKGGGKAKALDFTGMQYNCNTLTQSLAIQLQYYCNHINLFANIFICMIYLFGISDYLKNKITPKL